MRCPTFAPCYGIGRFLSFLNSTVFLLLIANVVRKTQPFHICSPLLRKSPGNLGWGGKVRFFFLLSASFSFSFYPYQKKSERTQAFYGCYGRNGSRPSTEGKKSTPKGKKTLFQGFIRSTARKHHQPPTFPGGYPYHREKNIISRPLFNCHRPSSGVYP